MQVAWKYLLSILGLLSSLVWLGVIGLPDGNLHIITCDVGQGDATLAIYKSNQVLIDGGPNNAVLDCLGKYIPFWDRQIEVVVLTHPEKDHFGGLIEVFERYEVQKFIANSVNNSGKDYQVLTNLVRGQGVEVVNPRKGMQVRLGLISLDILSESDRVLTDSLLQLDQNVLGVWTQKGGLNEFSIVAKLSLGDFDALLTGDITPQISDELAKELAEGGVEPIEYIKVPHHGSKNGLTENLLNATGSKTAVISAGKNNSYGHPHREILEILRDYDTKILRTDQMGDVEVVTDGNKYWIEE